MFTGERRPELVRARSRLSGPSPHPKAVVRHGCCEAVLQM